MDLGLEQENLVPACAVIEIEGEAGLVGIEGKLVSEERLEGTLMGFDDWFYAGHMSKGVVALTTTLGMSKERQPCSVVEEGSNMVTYGLDPGVESGVGWGTDIQVQCPAGH